MKRSVNNTDGVITAVFLSVTFTFLLICGYKLYYNGQNKEVKTPLKAPEQVTTMIVAKAIAKNGGYISKLYINRFDDGVNTCYIYGEGISCIKGNK